ncbi:S46 family peptidase [Mesoterricola silvestris]|uniref:Dipeptidyl-peptidase n=1 Tax=Mesoterricola silvestris TaxID=2927979 RepID=A0AA48GL89_9BACT|nr:S46 family peptidase [Mesoterricola silvestris]BDU71849.1 dipeptidyl-peptidase [Mesoterricola silvestris]
MKRSALGIAFTLVALTGLHADEGMWTFDNLPAARMKAKYDFTPDAAWLDHVRLATVRFPGGTGSFISGDGLVLTNHHVGHGWIERVSDAAHDYVKNGFVAKDRQAEIKVPGLELATLMAMENVTAQVAKAAGDPREALARLARESGARTGLRCEPVSLYQGGESWLYSYKIHKDVRLVMAPEYAIAAFGMDWDNFSFPRHDLDFSLFRVYEDGKPYVPPHHLAFAPSGPKYGDLTLVVGHPGHTSRLETLAQMEAYRDALNPARIRTLDRTRKALHAFAARGAENARIVSGTLMGLENSYKVFVNETLGLKDKDAMAAVAAAEKELREAVAKDPALQASTGRSWDLVAEAMARRSAVARESAASGGSLLGYVHGLLRLEEQLALPAAQRGAGYRTDKELEARRAALGGRRLTNPGLERETFLAAAKGALEDLGPDHPFVKALLDGRSPEAATQALFDGTRLLDPAARAKAAEAGVKGSTDPLVVLGRRLFGIQESLRKVREETEAVIAEQGARIARARFQVKGRSVYPDATFTLRLSYGAVETYPANGTLAQPFTTFGGLYDRADAWGPDAENHSWELPERWVKARGKLDMSTHFDFITTNDIIGGNSGSPMVDRQGRVVGLVFDGNIESNAGRFFFDPRVNRAVSVDASAILEALSKVYDANHLATEIKSK